MADAGLGLTPDALGFDPEQLAERYRLERDKRVREDAEAQFVEVANDSPFANKYLAEDPYSEPLVRDPIQDDRDVIVIGGGWVGRDQDQALRRFLPASGNAGLVLPGLVWNRLHDQLSRRRLGAQ